LIIRNLESDATPPMSTAGHWTSAGGLSGDTQVGPLTVNVARLATMPAELAQFLNIMCRVSSRSVPPSLPE
jgi:hypothetical protein